MIFWPKNYPRVFTGPIRYPASMMTLRALAISTKQLLLTNRPLAGRRGLTRQHIPVYLHQYASFLPACQKPNCAATRRAVLVLMYAAGAVKTALVMASSRS